jgi:hypothetical protein
MSGGNNSKVDALRLQVADLQAALDIAAQETGSKDQEDGEASDVMGKFAREIAQIKALVPSKQSSRMIMKAPASNGLPATGAVYTGCDLFIADAKTGAKPDNSMTAVLDNKANLVFFGTPNDLTPSTQISVKIDSATGSADVAVPQLSLGDFAKLATTNIKTVTTSECEINVYLYTEKNALGLEHSVCVDAEAAARFCGVSLSDFKAVYPNCDYYYATVRVVNGQFMEKVEVLSRDGLTAMLMCSFTAARYQRYPGSVKGTSVATIIPPEQFQDLFLVKKISEFTNAIAFAQSKVDTTVNTSALESTIETLKAVNSEQKQTILKSATDSRVLMQAVQQIRLAGTNPQIDAITELIMQLVTGKEIGLTASQASMLIELKKKKAADATLSRIADTRPTIKPAAKAAVASVPASAYTQTLKMSGTGVDIRSMMYDGKE